MTYILVTCMGSETSLEEFNTLEELKEEFKERNYGKENFFIAKVLATSESVIDDIKEE